MHQLIHIVTAEIVAFLAIKLPHLNDNWWNVNVVDNLSFQQQRILNERGLKKLEQLDLAALLRVFDQNWYELSYLLNFPREGRTWIKELQTVRNRWAHLSARPELPQDRYRDSDTLARILGMIDASPQAISAVEAAKGEALSEMKTVSEAFRNSRMRTRKTGRDNELQVNYNTNTTG